jgi:hypothetical protein
LFSDGSLHWWVKLAAWTGAALLKSSFFKSCMECGTSILGYPCRLYGVHCVREGEKY